MIERILPPAVAAVELFSDVPDATPYAEEAAVIANSVDKRRREFTTVRHCARLALGRIGVPPVALLPGTRGAPRWPAGVVGSMTHCDGYRAAAVARAGDIAAIGVDAEPNLPLPPGVLDAIAVAEERARLRRLSAGDPHTSWDRLLFSAKESVYKAWYPLIGRFLDFPEADIDFDPAAGTFTARLRVPAPLVEGEPLTGFHGRYAVDRGLVVTAIALLVRDASPARPRVVGAPGA